MYIVLCELYILLNSYCIYKILFNSIVYSIKFANCINYFLYISRISNRLTFDHIRIYICFPESWLLKHLPAHHCLTQEQKQVEQLLCLLSYRSTPLSQLFSLPFPCQEKHTELYKNTNQKEKRSS